MKTAKLLTLAVLGLAAVTGCNKENGANDPMGITIKAGIGNMTKVSYEGNKSTFVAGDNLSLFAWTGDKTAIPNEWVVYNVTNTLASDGNWKPATQIKWADMVTEHYFIAVSPARTVTSLSEDPFVLDPATEKFQQSDLLFSTNLAGLKANDNPVELTFDHAMAKLNVNLAFRDQWTPLPKEDESAPNVEALVASVVATAKKNATLNYLTKTVTATGEQVAVSLNKLANANWTSLMVPQAGFRTISINLSGNDEWLGGNGTFVYNASEDIKLESGKITTVNLIVGRNQITLAPEGITITDWAEGETINNGEAQIPDDELLALKMGDYFIYYHEGDTWGDTFNIAENQQLYQAWNARISTGNIYITAQSTDYILYEDGSLVNPDDEINANGFYYFSSVQD